MTIYSPTRLRGFARYLAHYHATNTHQRRVVAGVEVFGAVTECWHYRIPDLLRDKAYAAGGRIEPCELGEDNE